MGNPFEKFTPPVKPNVENQGLSGKTELPQNNLETKENGTKPEGIFQNNEQRAVFQMMRSAMNVEGRIIARAFITRGPDILACVEKAINAQTANRGGLDMQAKMAARKDLSIIFEQVKEETRREDKEKIAA